ncbi:putative phage abortive infection protein [Ancylomarina longa]|uniref:Phage abortive infection protein n=1 Tax=Ancylomarina longa TaxID=2487017 RepID=A0A434AEY2_9BACT|nr:putative phage abortive infection protein [Ancylomarina longa]RUT72933.1 hypothetical protein DLK05_15855 [Ancylomarina longa]
MSKKSSFSDLKRVITYKRVALLSILIGVGIMAIFGYLLLVGNYEYSGKDITLDSIDLTYKIGSFLGAVIGPFWTLAGVFLYYTALNYQKDEIKKSQEATQIQSFETTFFNLLNNQRSITENIKGIFTTSKDLNYSRFQIMGLDYFRISKQALNYLFKSISYKKHLGRFSEESLKEEIAIIHEEYPQYEHELLLTEENDIQKLKIFNKTYNLTEDIWDNLSRTEVFEKEKKSYELFFKVHHYEIGHYFRHLYNILNFIESSEKHFSERNIVFDHKKYANFIQAQMSSFELMLLFYNVLFFDKTKRLVLKYGILDNLAKEDLINTSDYFEQTGIKLKTRDELLFS